MAAGSGQLLLSPSLLHNYTRLRLISLPAHRKLQPLPYSVALGIFCVPTNSCTYKNLTVRIMTLKILVVLTLLNVVNGSPVVTVTPGSSSVDLSAHPNSVPNTAGEGNQTSNGEEVAVELLDTVEDVMATVELIPDHFPAQRAAHVVRHYLNTLYGSPYRWVGLQQVYSAKSEDVESGKKYQLEISVQEMISNTKEHCSAEVVFPGEEVKSAPQVNASCEALLKINTTAQEEALYEQYKTSQLSTNNLPDSYGHIDNSMKPFWQLGGVAASFVMLNESTENTLYNMAQVANVTQLETENNHLRFNYHILLHEMISQEIIHWKMLVTWAPAEGVNVLQTEQLPKCHECVVPTML